MALEPILSNFYEPEAIPMIVIAKSRTEDALHYTNGDLLTPSHYIWCLYDRSESAHYTRFAAISVDYRHEDILTLLTAA